MVGWLVGWLVRWLVGWLVGWLNGWLVSHQSVSQLFGYLDSYSLSSSVVPLYSKCGGFFTLWGVHF